MERNYPVFKSVERRRDESPPALPAVGDLLDGYVAADAFDENQGITFSLLGEERPFPLDLVPSRSSSPGSPDPFLRLIRYLGGVGTTRRMLSFVSFDVVTKRVPSVATAGVRSRPWFVSMVPVSSTRVPAASSFTPSSF